MQTTQAHYAPQEQQKERKQHQHGDRGTDSQYLSSPQVLNIHPQRERWQPAVLTYEALGQTTVREAGMESTEVSIVETLGTHRHTDNVLKTDIRLEGQRKNGKNRIFDTIVSGCHLLCVVTDYSHMLADYLV